MNGPDDDSELKRIRTQLLATEELLAVHEQAVLAQSDRLEQALSDLRDRQEELESVNATLAVARDQALKASMMKSQFLANMSHEIRTPISTVIGMAELLLDTGLSDEQKRLVTILNESAQSLLAIINDILDFSKMEAGKIELSPCLFSLRDLVGSTAAMLKPSAGQKGITLSATVDSEVPDWLFGDPVRLRQVILNLLANAVKFTSEGSIDLTARTTPLSEDRVVLNVSVSDTGIGMTAEESSRIFSPFEQADGSSTRRARGTGLGLSICKNLVELMGGEIGLTSEKGRGSTFWFSLPLDLRPAAGAGTENLALASLPPNSHARSVEIGAKDTIRVLVAEDNPTLQELAVRQLDKLGYTGHGVSTGQQAVEAVLSGHYHLVLMDCQMPDLDGLAATRAIRKVEGNTGMHIPIVAMTAGVMKEDRERCLEAGMDDFLSKPVRLAELKTTLARWLKVNGAPAG